ncbi:MAG: glycerophosphodiester phosphodiesterase family protein [Gemmobacter sp.]
MQRPPLPPAFLRAPLAHRGYHGPGRPENSRAAFRAAIAAGYGIELDVQVSRDGQAMVFHDERLSRLTGAEGAVADRDAADLGRITLLGGDEGIPTLPEVLALVAGRVPLLIEIKDRHGTLASTDGVLEAAVVRALQGYAGPVAVMSFNPAAIAEIARIAPQLPRGLTTDPFDPADWSPLPPATCGRLRAIPDYDAVGASFLSHYAADLASARVGELRAQGAGLLCWTIRSPEAEAQARRLADNVTFEGYAAAIPA